MSDPRTLLDLIGAFALVGFIGCALAVLLGIIGGIATTILDRPKRRKP